jgi:hypothetical protein
MNYKIIDSKDIPTCFDVVETATNVIVKTFPLYQDARKFLRHLNLGGAFDGWTPMFMVKKFPIPKEKVAPAV